MLRGDFENNYLDQLRIIETAIMNTYYENNELVDFNVKKVLEGLERTYTAEIKGRKPPRLRLKPLEETLFKRVKAACDYLLGRTEKKPGRYAINLGEANACLKRIQISVSLYREGGRQGYLNFLTNFLPEHLISDADQDDDG